VSEALEVMADTGHNTVMVSDDNVVRPRGMCLLTGKPDPFSGFSQKHQSFGGMDDQRSRVSVLNPPI